MATVSTLAALGMRSFRVEATSFSPQPSGRGPDRKSRVTQWTVTASPLDASRPPVVVTRPTIPEAVKDCCATFESIYSKRPSGGDDLKDVI